MENITGNEMRRAAEEMMKANKLRHRNNNKERALLYRSRKPGKSIGSTLSLVMGSIIAKEKE